jgi:hypothetical protein
MTFMNDSPYKQDIIRGIRDMYTTVTCVFEVLAHKCVAASLPIARFPPAASTFYGWTRSGMTRASDAACSNGLLWPKSAGLGLLCWKSYLLSIPKIAHHVQRHQGRPRPRREPSGTLCCPHEPMFHQGTVQEACAIATNTVAW